MVGASSVTKTLSGASFVRKLLSMAVVVTAFGNTAFAAGRGDRDGDEDGGEGGGEDGALAGPGTGVNADGLLDATAPPTWRDKDSEAAAEDVPFVGDG